MSVDSKALAERALGILKKRGLKLAFAESCTGGLMADSIVSLSGASEVFLGSIVSYDISIKRNLLGIGEKTVRECGVVSSECALEMAKNARRLFKSDIALSSTGFAEPSEDAEYEPCIYLAISAEGFCEVKKIAALSARNENRAAAAMCALEMLLCYLQEGQF